MKAVQDGIVEIHVNICRYIYVPFYIPSESQD